MGNGRTWAMTSRVRKNWHSILKNWRAYKITDCIKLGQENIIRKTIRRSWEKEIRGFNCEDEIFLASKNKF